MTNAQITQAILSAVATLGVLGAVGFVGGWFVGKALDWALDVEGEGE